MDARAAQVPDVPVVADTRAQASATALGEAFDWRRHVTGILTVVVALAAGLALVPSFVADLAYRDAKVAADAAYLDEAEAQARRAISWTPQDAYLYKFLGEIYYRKALFRTEQRRAYLDQALVALERSTRLNPYEAKTFTSIGWTHLYQGDARSAEVAFAKAKVLDPNNPYVRYSLGTAYLWQKKLTQARVELEFARRYMADATEVQAALREIDRLEGARTP